MRILRFDVEELLGLRGSIDFTGGPILIYGKNIAGKSNIVNLIRYLLIKPKSGRKRYSESLRLKKEELLFDKEKGSCTLYLSAGRSLYKISLFARRGKGVSTSYSISSFSGTASYDALPSLKWTEKKKGKGEKIWEDLKELNFYPDLLEVLISPSNVKNFEEAISGELVSVPDMVKEELNKIHTGTKNYIDTLAGLEVVLSQEEEKISKREAELRKGFASPCSEIGIDPSCFDKDIKTLEATGKMVAEMRKTLVEEKTQLKRELESPELETKVKTIQGAKEFLKRKEETENNLKALKKTKERAEETKKFGTFLVDIKARRIEDIIAVEVPPPAGLSGEAREIAGRVGEASNLVSQAKVICERHGIAAEDIKRLLPSYKELWKCIKHPLEGATGAKAVVFRNGEKSIVSIPVEEAEENPEVFVELEPLPKVHIGKEKTGKVRLKTVEERVEAILSDVKSAEEFLRKAGQLLRDAKSRSSTLEQETKTAEEQAKKLNELLVATVRGLAESAGSLKIFGIQTKVADNVEALPEAFKNLSSSFKNAKEVLRKELEKISPEISPETPVEKVLEKLQEKKDEVDRREKACANLEIWITQNLAEIVRLRSKKETIELLKEANSVCKEVLEAIHQRTDIGAMIESISENVSREVEMALKAVLPDSTVEFIHLEEGQFECEIITGGKITHPGGSERVCMSMGVMVSLANCFDVPVIFDEALDRIDADNVAPFVNYLTGVSQSIQICIVACKSFNIEKNPKLREPLLNWKMYRVSVKGKEKLIEPISVDLILEKAS